jgi:hypothetical protein
MVQKTSSSLGQQKPLALDIPSSYVPLLSNEFSALSGETERTNNICNALSDNLNNTAHGSYCCCKKLEVHYNIIYSPTYTWQQHGEVIKITDKSQHQYDKISTVSPNQLLHSGIIHKIHVASKLLKVTSCP